MEPRLGGIFVFGRQRSLFYSRISRTLALKGFKTDLAAGLDAVLSELDGDGNNVMELREKTAATH